MHNLVLAQGTYVPNMNFIGPQIAELLMCVSVAMVTRFTTQQNNTQSHIGPNIVPNMSFKSPQIAELDMIHDP